jgi:uncharacterized membrane protein YkgB
VLNAMQLLEFLMKNCNSIHPLVANSEFMEFFTKIAVPVRKSDFLGSTFLQRIANSEKDPNEFRRREKALILIQAWAWRYRNGNYPIFLRTFDALRSEGINFPEGE